MLPEPAKRVWPIASYDPNPMFDMVMRKLGLRYDVELARAIDMSAPALSRMRHRGIPVGPAILVRLHEASGLTVSALRALMGDHRSNFKEPHVLQAPRKKAGRTALISI